MVKASNWDQPKSPYETLGDWIFLNWEKFKASRFDFVNSGISNKFIVSVFFSNTELERDADDDQIKIAYRRLAKFYHPDGLFLYLH